MNKFKRYMKAQPVFPISPAATYARPVSNVGVTISKANRRVLIQDRDRVYSDILVEGEEMSQFLDELKTATRDMPNVPIGQALAAISAPYFVEKWC